MFNIDLTANLLRNLTLKCSKSAKLRQKYGHESVAPFLAHPVDVATRSEEDRATAVGNMH